MSIRIIMVYLLLFKRQMYINMHDDLQWKWAPRLKLMSSVHRLTSDPMVSVWSPWSHDLINPPETPDLKACRCLVVLDQLKPRNPELGSSNLGYIQQTICPSSALFIPPKIRFVSLFHIWSWTVTDSFQSIRIFYLTFMTLSCYDLMMILSVFSAEWRYIYLI